MSTLVYGESHTVSGVLNVNTTQYSTPADTSAHDAITYDIPANALSYNGRTVRVKAYGSFGATGDSKTVTLYFGSTAIATATSSGNAKDWVLQAEVVRTGAATQKGIGDGVADATQAAVAYTGPTEDTTAAITAKIVAQNAVANAADIVVEGMIVELLN